jgi:FHA domain
MKVCIYCGMENRENSSHCSQCGRELSQTMLVNPLQEARETYKLPSAPGQPELFLMVRTKEGLIPVPLPFGKSVILGRIDPDSGAKPDVDFTVFSGQVFGVSRVHARIEYAQQAPTITDLGSSNGTYLNRQKLPPRQAAVLRYGDELCLGRLVMFVYVQ